MLAATALLACGDDAPPPPPPPAPGCPLEGNPPAVVNIDSDHNFTMALLADGTVTCWGEEIAGSCAYGNGIAGLLPRPGRSPLVACITDIQVSEGFVTGVAADGDLRLWGSEIYEVLPEEKAVVATFPLKDLQPRAIGSGYRFVVTESSASEYFVLGIIPLVYGAQNPPSFQAIRFEAFEFQQLELSGVSRDISSGGQHFCVAMETGDLWCMGNNRSGQLALPGVPYAATPTNVPVLEPVLAVETDLEVTCVLGASGQVYCAGTNATGQLGRPFGEPGLSETFLLVEGLPPAANLWVAGSSACAMTTDGLWCWGYNAPAPFRAGEPAVPVDVALTSETICVLDIGGTVYCTSLSTSAFLGRCFGDDLDWQPVNLNLLCD